MPSGLLMQSEHPVDVPANAATDHCGRKLSGRQQCRANPASWMHVPDELRLRASVFPDRKEAAQGVDLRWLTLLDCGQRKASPECGA